MITESCAKAIKAIKEGTRNEQIEALSQFQVDLMDETQPILDEIFIKMNDEERRTILQIFLNTCLKAFKI